MRWTVILLSLALTASAAPPFPVLSFREGEVVIATAGAFCVVDPSPPPFKQVDVHGPDGAFIRRVNGEAIFAAGYEGGSVYVAHDTVAMRKVEILGADGSFSPFLELGQRRATAFGSVNLDVVIVVDNLGQPDVWRLHGDAVDVTPLPRYDHFVESIDVASDRCTTFYATVDSIDRVDICTKRPLGTFVRAYATAVRVLPDGGIIVASGRDLVRYDAIGNAISRFTLTSGSESIGAIALAPNPAFAWVLTTFGCGTGPAQLMQLDIATGRITAGPHRVSNSGGYVLAVQGEWHAATDLKPPTPRRRAVR